MATAQLTAVVSTKGVEKANKELKGLTTNSKKVETNVIRAEKRFKSFGKNASAAIAAVDGPLGGISSRVSALTTVLTSGTAAMTLFAGAFVGAGVVIVQGISALDEFEVNLKRVNATIKATGEGVGFTGVQLRDEAESLALATLTSVDAVQKAQAKLLTFNRVLGAEFEKSIRLSQDLAEAGFGSIESNAILLGKALQDPIKGMAALSRVGVTLSDTQKDLAQEAIAVGDIFAAQGIILDAVAGQVEGVAKAVADGTLAGAIDTLGQNWDELTRNVAASTGALEVWTRIVNGAAVTAKNIAEAFGGDSTDDIWNDRLEAAQRLATAEQQLEEAMAKSSSGYGNLQVKVNNLKKEVQGYDEALKASIKTDNDAVIARGEAQKKEIEARKRIAEEVKDEADKVAEAEKARIAEKEARDKERAERELERIKKQNQREIDLAKSKEDRIADDKKRREEQTNRERKDEFNKFTDNLETVLGRENALFKAAAVTNATIKTYEAANSAYAAMAGIPVVGPALGAAAAGAAVAAGIVNVRAITSAREQGGSLSAGQSSTVAERGQLEILTPSSSSRIRTKQQMQQLMGDGGNSAPQINVVNINQSSAPLDIETTTDDDGRIINLIRDTQAIDAANPNSELRKSLAATTTLEARR